MILGSNEKCELELNRTMIEQILNTKFLGITISSNLRWESHIEIVINQLKRGFSVLSQLTQSLKTSKCKLLFNALIQSF